MEGPLADPRGMRYVDEYRDGGICRAYAEDIARITRGSWTVMEVCGGQTHAIMRYSIDRMLPGDISLVHGPGCPVCVTPLEAIDRAVELASIPEVVVCSFGDMIRVPGSTSDLMSARAAGGDVRIVYSPLDAVRIAAENPARQVVFFAVGFETTAPVTAMSVLRAKSMGLANYTMLVSHVLVPPAMRAVLSSPSCRIQAFLAAGHVCAVTGWADYEPISRDFSVPIVVTGFEPADILQGLHMAVSQLEEGRCEVENQYRRAVRREGNREAMSLVERVFAVEDRKWRGLGLIPDSGYGLAGEFGDFDAARRFGLECMDVEEPRRCMAGKVLTGELRPDQCPEFAAGCDPSHPLGAPMVSGEGACAAYFRYRRKGTRGDRDD